VNQKRVEVPYPELRAIGERAGLRPGMSRDEGIRRLTPFRGEIVDWLYGHLAATIRGHGAVPVWVFIPQVYGDQGEPTVGEDRRVADKHGFMTIDLSDVYAGGAQEDLWLAEWDLHPNASGHRMIAERLYREILARQDALRLRR
jgi:hypothetical protein